MKNKKIITLVIVVFVILVFGFICINNSNNLDDLSSSNDTHVNNNQTDKNEHQNINDNSNSNVFNDKQDTSNDNNQQKEDESNNTNPDVTYKEEAYYEEWLAAAMCMSLTLTEDSFNIQHIYYSTETNLNNKMDSKGVYLIYENGEETICIYSSALKEENKENGAINLYTQDLGFNSYQKVDFKEMNFDDFKEIDLDSLSILISQSMLVSLYEN